MRLKSQHQFLEEMSIIECANPNILFSYDAKTYGGATLYPFIKLREYLKQKLIYQIPFSIRPSHSRRQVLYALSGKGASFIGKPNSYRYRTSKAYRNIDHEIMKYTIALAFVRQFPDFNIEVEYEKRFLTGNENKRTGKPQQVEVDIFLTATHKTTDEKLTFLIETENKEKVQRSFKEKVLVYESFIKGFFKRNGLSDNTKILFILTNRELATFTLPIEYSKPLEKSRIDKVYAQFGHFMESAKKLEGYRPYRFLPYIEYLHLSEPIWFTPRGNKVSLIN